MIDFHSNTLTHARWEVVLDGENVWQLNDEPHTFATEEEAWAEIDEYFRDCEEAVRQGYMEDVDYDINLRVRQVK